MLPLFTMLFLSLHHRPPRNRESSFQAVCVWVSTFKFLLCLTTPRQCPKHPHSLLKDIPSTPSAVFFMDSQFSRPFFRLHLLCRILLPNCSLLKRSMIPMHSAYPPFIFKPSLEMVFIQWPPWELPPPSFTCWYCIILFFSSLGFLCISTFSSRHFSIFNSLTQSIFILQVKICLCFSVLYIISFFFVCLFDGPWFFFKSNLAFWSEIFEESNIE